MLLEKEETHRLKSRATWLEAGDDNTKFFHDYAKGRKVANTIWSLDNSQGESQITFGGMSRTGVDHFHSLFRENNQATIAEVVIVAQLFPRFVEEDDNRFLMEAVSKEELKASLQSVQKDKNLGLDGWNFMISWEWIFLK